MTAENLPPVQAWLLSLGIPSAEAAAYYDKLEEDGFDTMEAVNTLEEEDLEDYGFRTKAKALVMEAIGLS